MKLENDRIHEEITLNVWPLLMCLKRYIKTPSVYSTQSGQTEVGFRTCLLELSLQQPEAE